MTDLVPSASMNPPARRDLREPDPQVQSLVTELVGFWPNDGSPVILRREQTRLERDRLRLRQRDLAMLLRPMGVEDRKHAGKALAAMFLGFPNMRVSNSEGIITAYIMALADFPLFAVTEACEDVVKRRVDINPDFAPTAPRMGDLATAHLAPLRGELATIEKTLSARVLEKEITPAERERISVGLHELAAHMVEKHNIDGEIRERLAHQAVVLQEANTKAILGEYRRLGIEPVYADEAKTILLS